MKYILGLITPLASYALITLLHIILPARKIKGKESEVPDYSFFVLTDL